MIIGLDARSFFDPAPSPKAHATLALYDQLTQRHPEWRFLVLYQNNRWRSGWHEFAERFRDMVNRPNVRCEGVPLDADVADTWLHVRLPLCARERRMSMLHLPDGVPPTWCPVPMLLDIDTEQAQAVMGKDALRDGLTLGRAWTRAALSGAIFMVAGDIAPQEFAEKCQLPSDQVRAGPIHSPVPTLDDDGGRSAWPPRTEIEYRLAEWLVAIEAGKSAGRRAREANLPSKRLSQAVPE